MRLKVGMAGVYRRAAGARRGPCQRDHAHAELWACQPPDRSGDVRLDFFDIQLYLQWYASGDARADFNADGLLDFFDVQLFLSVFAAGCP